MTTEHQPSAGGRRAMRVLGAHGNSHLGAADVKKALLNRVLAEAGVEVPLEFANQFWVSARHVLPAACVAFFCCVCFARQHVLLGQAYACMACVVGENCASCDQQWMDVLARVAVGLAKRCCLGALRASADASLVAKSGGAG